MSDAEQREEAVFDAALKLSADERGAYLDKTCANDAELRRRVEGLLGAFDRAGGFLNEAPLPASAKTISLQPTEKPGDRIGRYKLLEQIGEGGCGVVYVAEQEEPVRRRVALKVIKLGMDTKQVIARFDAERQALAMMDHPNIAKVLDAGATDTGRPYFVMELVRGIKITDYCDQNHLPPRERLDLFVQVCRAIQHAHQKGVIHRDIKPSNILVTLHDGVPVPKVIDFGIAKATQGRLTDQTVYTAFEQFIGTPAYMSPEQAEMSGLDIDTRSDIYSLGVLLYELLTGKTPFDAKELMAAGLDELRRTIREVEPVKPSTRLTQDLIAADVRRLTSKSEIRNPKSEIDGASSRRLLQAKEFIHALRGDLDWIVMKCLEKDRTRRYEAANGLATDIQRHLSNEPIVARPPSNIYRFRKLVQRNKLAFAIAVVLALLPVVIIASLLFSNARIVRERNQKETALKEKGVALDAATKSEQDARNKLFLALRSQAQARRNSRQMGQRLDSLAALAEAARIKPDETLRDEAIAAMAVPDLRFGSPFGGSDAGSKSFHFDPFYRSFAWVDPEGLLHIRTVPDGREIARFSTIRPPRPGALSFPSVFSPDGRLLARIETGSSTLRVWRLADSQSVLRDTPTNCSGIAFSANSRQLAVGQGSSIICFDLPTGELRSRCRTQQRALSLQFSPDNRKLAVGYVDTDRVSIFGSADGTLLAELPTGSSYEEIVAWHPDGNHLAVAGSDPRIQIWAVNQPRKIAVLEGHSQNVTALSFHNRGELLISGSWDGTARLWRPSPPLQLMEVPLAVGFVPRFSQDGRWAGVVYRDEAQLLEMIPSQEYQTFFCSPRDDKSFLEGDINADGRLLALGGPSAVRLWDIGNGRELTGIPMYDAASALFQPDGGELITSSPDSGLQRWNIAPDGAVDGEIQLGPPRRISLPFRSRKVARSRDGRTLAVAAHDSGRAVIVNLEKQSVRELTPPHAQPSWIALSPDARWVATCGWFSEEVWLRDLQGDGAPRKFAVGTQTRVSFTPDSRELLVSRAQDFLFYDLKTFEVHRRLTREIGSYAGHVAWSPDGKLMALEMEPGVIHLLDAASHGLVAKLTDPNRDRSFWIGFTPDGTQLIVVATYVRAIHRWDLRAIRAHLKTMGLDWDSPEFPPAANSQEANLSSLKLRVINAEVR